LSEETVDKAAPSAGLREDSLNTDPNTVIDDLSVGGSCASGDDQALHCVWGIPFPGVWQWALVVRYESTQDGAARDLTVISGTSRFWKFADSAG